MRRTRRSRLRRHLRNPVLRAPFNCGRVPSLMLAAAEVAREMSGVRREGGCQTVRSINHGATRTGAAIAPSRRRRQRRGVRAKLGQEPLGNAEAPSRATSVRDARNKRGLGVSPLSEHTKTASVLESQLPVSNRKFEISAASTSQCRWQCSACGCPQIHGSSLQ